MENIKYIGMDVHKKTISIGIAEDNRNGEVRFYGKINNDMDYNGTQNLNHLLSYISGRKLPIL